MATERIVLVFEERGGGRVERTFRRQQAAAVGASTAVNALRAGLLALGAVRIATGLTDFLDTATRIDNRLKLLTPTLGETDRLFKELNGIARETRSGLEPTVDLFTKLTRAGQNLAISQQQLLDLTRGINQSFQIYGNTAEEARGATVQFLQGLARGVLRGQELLSVTEQAPRLATALADGLNEIEALGEGVVITSSQLNQLGEQGLLTADNLTRALLTQLPKLRAEFERTNPTIQSGAIAIGNAAVALTRDLNNATGVTQAIGRGLFFLADNLGTIARILAAGAIVAGLVGIQAAVAALAGLLARNPLTILATGLAVAASAAITFGDQIKLSAKSSATLLDLLAVIATDVGNAFSRAFTFIGNTLNIFEGDLESIDIETFVNNFGRGLDLIQGVFAGGFAAAKTFAINALAEISKVLGDVINSLNAFITRFIPLANLAQQTGDLIGVDLNPLTAFDANDFIPTFEDAGMTAGEAYREAYFAALGEGTGQQFTQNLLGRANERAADREARKLARKNKRTGGGLTRVVSTLGGDGDDDTAERITRIQTLFANLIGQIDEFNEKFPATVEGFAALKIELGEGGFLEGAIDQLGRLTEGFESVAVNGGRIFTDFFDQIGTGFADTIGNAIVQGEDLEESLKSVARNALSQLISSLIQLGIQASANAFLSQSLQAGSTAATVGQLGAIATAAAPAAAGVSLATAGGNAAPASIGIGSVVGIALAAIAGAAALSAFRDGGIVGGRGGPRSDSNLALLSRGEFVVNAASAAQFLPLLEAINGNGQGPAGPVTNNTMNFNMPNVTDDNGFRQSSAQVRRGFQRDLSRLQ